MEGKGREEKGRKREGRIGERKGMEKEGIELRHRENPNRKFPTTIKNKYALRRAQNRIRSIELSSLEFNFAFKLLL